jgi:hypothetical protein
MMLWAEITGLRLGMWLNSRRLKKLMLRWSAERNEVMKDVYWEMMTLTADRWLDMKEQLSAARSK